MKDVLTFATSVFWCLVTLGVFFLAAPWVMKFMEWYLHWVH